MGNSLYLTSASIQELHIHQTTHPPLIHTTHEDYGIDYCNGDDDGNDDNGGNGGVNDGGSNNGDDKKMMALVIMMVVMMKLMTMILIITTMIMNSRKKKNDDFDDSLSRNCIFIKPHSDLSLTAPSPHDSIPRMLMP